MNPISIHKFGGTSVADAERLLAAARLVIEDTARHRPVVVASAMARVTDGLLRAASAASSGDLEASGRDLDALEARHVEVARVLSDQDDGGVNDDIYAAFAEMRDVLSGVASLRECTRRALDRVVSMGEKLSVRLFALALRREGARGIAVDADTFLETSDQFGAADPIPEMLARTTPAALTPHLEARRIPVVTGFIGRAPDGATTTLGRGGSDYTATLLAAALGASAVTIWTDVPGVFSADPRVVSDAQVIQQLNYREAAELSYYGAKVLHPRTMIPVVDAGIAVRIADSFEPGHPGTTVDGRYTPGSHPVKAISAVREQALVSVEGKGMTGLPGIAARLFTALAEDDVSVTMISQSSSEASICVAVPERAAAHVEMRLKAAFRGELSRGEVEEIVVERGVALAAVVGLGMAHTPGVSGRVFGALGRAGVNVLAIAQGSSELNISLAVPEARLAAALRALHHDLGLHRVDTGVEAPDGMDLLLLGAGNIGRELLQLVLDRQRHVFSRFNLDVRVVAIADRSGYVLQPDGLPRARIERLLVDKAEGRPLAAHEGAVVTPDAIDMVRAALRYRLSRPVLVDVSDADGAGAAFEEALAHGCDVVTANKKPLAGPHAAFEALMAEVRRQGAVLRAEATVGAGLPVIDSLDVLLATGDRLRSAEGALSGTLGFVMARLEAGARFSEAVAEAVRRGYTEPDPMADLSGADVGRKAVILGRLAGLLTEDTPVTLAGLVDERFAGMPREQLLEALTSLDEAWADRVAAARAEGKVLRYLARVTEGRAEVGVRAVPLGTPFAALAGTDNMIVLSSERYDERPLVVSGPGAGIGVTAMGVLGDVLRVAAERR